MSKSHFPRKHFGQHFLKDNNIINKIVTAIQPQPNEILVEIGAGTGALTDEVLKLINHLHVVEIDKDLSLALSTRYPPEKLTLYRQDALRFDFEMLCTHPLNKLRIFGNLPYNISTPLLFHFLAYPDRIEDMVFMLQKEVVDRMGALPNSKIYGRLSIMIQYACEVHILFDVGPQAFSPPPKVMSSVVRLKPYDAKRPFPLAHNYKLFAQIVNAAFSHRRKTLKNAVEKIVPLEIFARVGIDPKRRPETLTIAEFVAISNAVDATPVEKEI